MDDLKLNGKETYFGNFISLALVHTGFGAAFFCILITVVSIFLLDNKIISTIFLALSFIYLAFSIYLECCRMTFSYRRGNTMGKIHQFLLNKYMWDGKGTCLDIGCGFGPLTIRSALTYPEGEFIGIDLWKPDWNYGKDICDKNAKHFGVDGRISFIKGNASKLDFSADTFDAVMANYIMKDIKSEAERVMIIREAMRVLKTGGFFAFQDIFSKKTSQGTVNDFFKQLEDAGITEIHYINNVENKMKLPSFIKTPWIVKNTSLIYGIK